MLIYSNIVNAFNVQKYIISVTVIMCNKANERQVESSCSE